MPLHGPCIDKLQVGHLCFDTVALCVSYLFVMLSLVSSADSQIQAVLLHNAQTFGEVSVLVLSCCAALTARNIMVFHQKKNS